MRGVTIANLLSFTVLFIYETLLKVYELQVFEKSPAYILNTSGSIMKRSRQAGILSFTSRAVFYVSWNMPVRLNVDGALNR